MEEAGTLAKRVLRMRSANEWMQGADEKAEPGLLFGEYWLEGELAVMFADTGQG